MEESTDPPRPLRVLHLIPASAAGGVSRYVFDLCFAAKSEGHDVAVAGEAGSWHWLFETAPFQWIEAPFHAGLFNTGLFASKKVPATLTDWTNSHPFDLLHVHDQQCLQIGRQLQQKHSAPMLFTLHQPDLRLGKPWTSDFGDHTHVASKEAREWLVNTAKVAQQLISVVPHGVDPRRFPIASDAAKTAAKEALGLKPTDLVATFVGRMDTSKNETWMLDLAEQSRGQLPNLKVVLVGEGPHEAMLRQSIQQKNLADRVVLLGRRDPMPIYHAADALLLPSQREGFSLVCAEAMSTGIPVLRTRTAGTDALVVENATGRSVPIDHKAFIDGSIEFLSDPAALKRMGALAAKHVQTHFTFDRQLRDTIDMYRSLIRLQG